MSTQTDFIKKVAPHAVKVMKDYKVLASLTIAQAALESGFGNSELSEKHNNLFGIKGEGDSGSVSMPTKEFVKGKEVRVTAAFAKFKSPYGSFERRAKLFINGVSWDKNKYRNLLGVTDYKVACKLVQKDGYATDPKYAQKLIDIIEKYDLNKYDKAAEHEEKIPAKSVNEYKQLVKWGLLEEGNHPDPSAMVKASDVWKLVHDAIVYAKGK